MIVSPTGSWEVRSDAAGDGHFGASRGDRLHKGVDLLCQPGQPIVAPFSCVFERIARPYLHSRTYSGALLRGEKVWAKLFYIDPAEELIGERLAQGQAFALAQDITEKMGTDARTYREQGMLPHIHLEIVAVDPLTLLTSRIR